MSANVENGSDILTGYGLFNEKRTVYIPVTKRADASTIDVVNRVKSELPRMQALIPEDIKVSFEFDQSTYVRNAVRGLALEGALGAILTGLMVLPVSARRTQRIHRRADDPVRAARQPRRTCGSRGRRSTS